MKRLTLKRRLRSARVVCCAAGTDAAAGFESYIDGEPDGSDDAAEDTAPRIAHGVFSFATFLGFLHDSLDSHTG